MTAPGAAVTAAHSFLSIRNYIEATYGAGSFRGVRDRLAARFPDFPTIFVPRAWYPTAALLAMVDAAHDLFGPEDFSERCGQKIVEYEVNVFLRFALRMTSPAWVLDKATEAWRSAHSTGTWQVSGTPGRVTARLDGFTTTAGYCRLLTAYFQALLERSGGRDVKVELIGCRGRGDASCVWLVTWNHRR